MDETSRPLSDQDDIEMMTVAEIMSRCEHERIGLVHGDRYTPVYRWATSSSGALGAGGYLLLDARGDQIDSAARKDDRLRVVLF